MLVYELCVCVCVCGNDSCIHGRMGLKYDMYAVSDIRINDCPILPNIIYYLYLSGGRVVRGRHWFSVKLPI